MASLKPRIKLTNGCGNSCWYCYSDVVNEEAMLKETLYIVLNRIKTIFNFGKFKRVKFSLTGGDPFSSDIIIDAMEGIRNTFKNIPYYVCGDTCQMADDQRLIQFLKMGGVSLLSLNEDPLENVMQKASIIKNRMYSFNIVLTDFNMDRIDEILYWVIKYNLPLRIDHLFEPTDKLNLADKMLDCVNYVYPKLLAEGHTYSLYTRPFGNIDGRALMSPNYCGYGVDHLYINTLGNVRQCQMTPIVGKIEDEDIMQKIQATVYNPTVECAFCEVYDLCKGGCPYTNAQGKYCKVLKSVCTHLKDKVYTDKFYRDEFFRWRL